MPEEINQEEVEEIVEDEVDPAWVDDAKEELAKEDFNGEIELFLSTDGKHTVHLKTGEVDKGKRQKMIAKAMELYDFVLTRYGTKQAQAVKEYAKENGKKEVDQETCPHTTVKFGQSHTEKNPGRWFKTCQNCNKFLSWQ